MAACPYVRLDAPTSPPPLALLLDLDPHAFLHSLTWVLI